MQLPALAVGQAPVCTAMLVRLLSCPKQSTASITYHTSFGTLCLPKYEPGRLRPTTWANSGCTVHTRSTSLRESPYFIRACNGWLAGEINSSSSYTSLYHDNTLSILNSSYDGRVPNGDSYRAGTGVPAVAPGRSVATASTIIGKAQLASKTGYVDSIKSIALAGGSRWWPGCSNLPACKQRGITRLTDRVPAI
jgi:hypothetical protein